MNKPYMVTCKACEKSFCSSNQKQKYHLSCLPEKKRRIYPKEFYNLRPWVSLRDEHKCRECDRSLKDEAKGVANIHHIDNDSTNNDLKNLVLLCQECHMRLHHSGLKDFDLPDFEIDKKEVVLAPPSGQMFRGI